MRWQHKQQSVQFSEQKDLLFTYLLDSTKRIVPFGADFNTECFSPFKISQQLEFLHIYGSGWATYMPQNRKQFPSFKQFTKNTALFLSKWNIHFIPLIQQSIKTHYGISTKYQIEKESQNYEIISFKEIQ